MFSAVLSARLRPRAPTDDGDVGRWQTNNSQQQKGNWQQMSKPGRLCSKLGSSPEACIGHDVGRVEIELLAAALRSRTSEWSASARLQGVMHPYADYRMEIMERYGSRASGLHKIRRRGSREAGSG